MKAYVLVHAYFDKSAFSVCGVTRIYKVAQAWSNANDENKVYGIEKEDITSWREGHKAWGE